MKKILAALALAASTTAFAAGPYDGVYQSPVNSNYFLSVHTNGNGIIVTGYSSFGINNLSITYGGGGTFRPDSLDFFDLLSGSINGTNATVSGSYAFRACQVTASITFSATGASTTFVNSVNTPLAATQGFNCAALFPTSALVFTKVY